MPQTDRLSAELDRLARVPNPSFPILSLYLDLKPDEHGRDHFEPFLRKQLSEQVRTYPSGGLKRESLERDAERVRAYVSGIDPSANGLALFACSGIDLFDPLPLAVSTRCNRLRISSRPHLYPLARLADEHRRYVVVVVDTRTARIFLLSNGAVERLEYIEGTKTERHKMGGWSQARYQRHVDNFHIQHAKQVAESLSRIVREWRSVSIVVAGDEVIVPLLKKQFSKELANQIAGVLKIDKYASDDAITEAAMAVMRERDARTDQELVDALLDAHRAGGRAVVGLERTRAALEAGQVEELAMAGTAAGIEANRNLLGEGGEDGIGDEQIDELIIKAHQTGARVCFVEDLSLAATIGGVGAFLRYKQ